MWVLLTVAVIAAAPAVLERARHEAANRTVELVVDLPALTELADLADMPLPDLLVAWKDAGVTSAAVPGYTLAQMGQAGLDYMAFNGREALLSAWIAGDGATPSEPLQLGDIPVRPDRGYLVLFPGRFPDWVAEDLQIRFAGRITGQTWHMGGQVIELDVDAVAVAHSVIGLARSDMAMVEAAGLRVAPRLSNFSSVDEAAVDYMAAAIRDTVAGPVGPVIFAGTQALGYPHALEATAAALTSLDIPVGLIEFSPQAGVPFVARLADFHALRVHSITPGEMQRISPEVAAARYARAVRERNGRVLYLRPFLEQPNGLAKADAYPINLDYVGQVVERVQAAGFQVGPARPFAAWATSLPLVLLLAGAVGGAGALVATRMWVVRPWLQWALVLMAVLATAFLWLKGYTVMARQAAAFGMAIILPVLAIAVAAERIIPAPTRGHHLQGSASPAGMGRVRAVLGAVALALGISLAGALILIGLLGDIRFMLVLHQFLGVKAAHVLPLIMLFLMWGWREAGWGAWTQAGKPAIIPPLRKLAVQAGRFLAGSVQWQHLAVAGGLVVAGVLYLGRTGSDILPVLEWEIRIRAFLEELLVIRPRTKEFLIGHPALVAGLGLLAMGRGRLGWLLLLVGAIGQISILNSFAHVHTPLTVTLVRTVYGLVLGAVLGGLILWLVHRFWGKAGPPAWWSVSRRSSDGGVSPGTDPMSQPGPGPGPGPSRGGSL